MAALASALVVLGSTSLRAQGSIADNLTVHGYLTQAYAKSSDLPVAGISKDATSDYRVAALQFRYAITGNDNFTVQLKHRRMGTNLLTTGESDVGLEWAFYAHRFSRGSLRVGRVPIPLGIYNEMRSVGTLLPFYRAPMNTYLEGADAIDGAVGSVNGSLGAWRFDASAYGGGLDYRSIIHLPQGAPIVSDLRVNKVYGGQAWITTPVRGVRVGGASLYMHLDIPGAPDEMRFIVSQASFDATFDRVMLRGELSDFNDSQNHTQSWYVHSRVGLTEKLSLSAQIDRAGSRNPLRGNTDQFTNADDRAVGLGYAFTPNLALKGEWHDAKGYGLFDQFMNVAAPAGKTNYYIASVAVAF
jgi:hypothetical protein